MRIEWESVPVGRNCWIVCHLLFFSLDVAALAGFPGSGEACKPLRLFLLLDAATVCIIVTALVIKATNPLWVAVVILGALAEQALWIWAEGDKRCDFRTPLGVAVSVRIGNWWGIWLIAIVSWLIAFFCRRWRWRRS